MAELVPRRRKRKLPPPPSRYEEFTNGNIDLSELDDEEVMRGQLKASDGSFRGAAPRSLPREFALALQREQHKRFNSKLPDMVETAMATIQEIMTSSMPQANDTARMNAARYIIDRFAGKTPENVAIKAEVTNKFEGVYGGLVVDDDEDIEDAEEADEDE